MMLHSKAAGPGPGWAACGPRPVLARRWPGGQRRPAAVSKASRSPGPLPVDEGPAAGPAVPAQAAPAPSQSTLSAIRAWLQSPAAAASPTAGSLAAPGDPDWWAEGDGMAAVTAEQQPLAAATAPTTGSSSGGGGGGGGAGRSTLSSYLLPSSLASLLGLGSAEAGTAGSAARPAESGSAETGASHAALTGPAAAAAAEQSMGHTEARPDRFVSSGCAAAADAILEGDGMVSTSLEAAAAAPSSQPAAPSSSPAKLPPAASSTAQQEPAAPPTTSRLQAPAAATTGQTPAKALLPQPAPGPTLLLASPTTEAAPEPHHPVLQLLRQRVAAGSTPGARADGCKLGLVLEGGGMRGCINGGALQALHDLGLRDAFDAVYGASAGALNATYFLSGQRGGVHIYPEHIATQEFISLRRLWRARSGLGPVLNLSFLIDSVMQDVLALDWDRVLASPIPLKVVASCLDSLGPVLLSGFDNQEDLAACLRASACVPEIAGGPVEHRGRRLVDAAVFEAIPFRSAIADGCTHVLALCNRRLLPWSSWSLGVRMEEAVISVVKRAVLSPAYMLPAWQAELENLRRDGMREDDILLRALEPSAHELPWFAGAHVLPVMPGPAASFSPLCTDAPTLRIGMEEGRRMVLEALQPVLHGLVDTGNTGSVEESNNILFLPRQGSPASGA